MLKSAKHCWNLHDSILFGFSSLWENFSSKMSVLVESKTLRPFVKLLTPDNNYSLDNREILKQPIQTQLSK